MSFERGLRVAVRYALAAGGIFLATVPAIALFTFSIMVLPRTRLHVVDARIGPAIVPSGIFLTKLEANALFVGAGLLVAAPLAVRYTRDERSLERLWTFVIALFVLGIAIAFVQIPLRARLDAWGIIPYYDRSYLQAGYALLLGVSDYVGCYLLVYGGGYTTLKSWVAS